MTTIISAKDVHLSYGNYEALHGISLDFKKKELTALIGPSGCGKSTFLRCLNRMNDDIENINITGEIKFEGQDIYNSKMDLVSLRKEVGMVFQQPTPFPFSVYDNVAYGLKIAGVKEKELIDPGRYQSGEMDSNLSITKHGNAVARKLLYRAIGQIDNAAKTNPCHIADYYESKKLSSQTKGFKKIAIASIHKLIRTIYALIINDQPYDYNVATHNQKDFSRN